MEKKAKFPSVESFLEKINENEKHPLHGKPENRIWSLVMTIDEIYSTVRIPCAYKDCSNEKGSSMHLSSAILSEARYGLPLCAKCEKKGGYFDGWRSGKYPDPSYDEVKKVAIEWIKKLENG